MPVKPGPADRETSFPGLAGEPPAQSPARKPKLFVMTLRCGRLGNRLSSFAHFIAFAEEFGHRVMNCTFHSYAHYFEATRRDVYCQYPPPSGQSWLDVTPGVASAIRKTRALHHAMRLAGWLNERIHLFGAAAVTLREFPGQQGASLAGPEVQRRIKDAAIVFVHGFKFQASECVERHARQIRSFFRPAQEYECASRDAVERLRGNSDIVVGVHIRHGDYRGWRGGKYFFPTSRYASWMGELTQQFPRRKVSFLICSNEPQRPDEFPGLAIGNGPGSAMGDLYALAKCDYLIGPKSTFSQWASFYGEVPLLHIYKDRASVRREEFQVSNLDLLFDKPD